MTERTESRNDGKARVDYLLAHLLGTYQTVIIYIKSRNYKSTAQRLRKTEKFGGHETIVKKEDQWQERILNFYKIHTFRQLAESDAEYFRSIYIYIIVIRK